jgi:hypothetical protein
MIKLHCATPALIVNPQSPPPTKLQRAVKISLFSLSFTYHVIIFHIAILFVHFTR